MISCGLCDEKMFDESYCKTCGERLEDDLGKCMFASTVREPEREDIYEAMERRKERRERFILSHPPVPKEMQMESGLERMERVKGDIHPLFKQILEPYRKAARDQLD